MPERFEYFTGQIITQPEAARYRKEIVSYDTKTAELTAGFDRTSLTRMTRAVKGMALKNSMRYGVPETRYSVNLERWRTRRLDHETGLTRRNFLFLTGAAAVSIPKTSAKDYHQAVDMFWQDGPHGPGKDLLAHLYYPPILEQRLKREGGDTDKMWDVIDRIRTQRYFSDINYARKVHNQLRELV